MDKSWLHIFHKSVKTSFNLLLEQGSPKFRNSSCVRRTRINILHITWYTVKLPTSQVPFTIRVTSVCVKWRCLLAFWKKTKASIWNIREFHWNLSKQKESIWCIEVTKIGDLSRIASLCVSFHLHTLHDYFSHWDFWPNVNFPCTQNIKKLVSNIYLDQILWRHPLIL